MITKNAQREQIQVMISQALVPGQDQQEQFNLADQIIQYLLDNFPNPELTTDNIRLTHYVLSVDTTQYLTDNYADLPDVIYPIAVMRYLATRLNEQLRFRGQEYPHMAAYINRYHIINVAIRRYNLRTIKTSTEIKEDEHIRDARKRGLSAVQWLHEWTKLEAEILAAKSTPETSQSQPESESL
jgi:hypothetical protein